LYGTGRRWTYARNKTIHGEYSSIDLAVLLNSQPVGRVHYQALQGEGQWHWRVNITQAHGQCSEQSKALNALRDSLNADLDEPF
jgi:hypothetical protein